MTNKNEQRKVPELRFPEFSGEWKENKLKDLTLLIKDGSHGTHKDVETGPWLLSAKNIKNNKINIDNNDRKISIDDYETIYRNYTLIKNDILLSIVGTIGRTALVENEENIAFQRSVAIIRPNKILTSTFLIQLMNGKRFQKDLKKYQVISAQPGIYLGDLNKLSISFPDKNEQQKIGEFFSKLDRQIELEEKKLALLEEQKKGYMQKIFSQELRFKDENGEEYNYSEIIDIADVKSGFSFPETLQGEIEYDVPFYKVSDMNINGNEYELKKSNNGLKNAQLLNEYKAFNKYGIVFAKVGAAVYLDRKRKVDPPFLIDNNLMVIIFDDIRTRDYVFYNVFNMKFSKFAQIGALPSINRKDILGIKVFMSNEIDTINITLDRIFEYTIRQEEKIVNLKNRKRQLQYLMFI